MGINYFTVMSDIQKQLKQLNNRRLDDDLPIDYQNTKEAMVDLHTAWQQFLSTVASHKSFDKAALSAVLLAATAIKFCTDCGEEHK